MIMLCINSGSSSVKYELYNWDNRESLASGIVERVTVGNSFCSHWGSGKGNFTVKQDCSTHKEAIRLVLDILTHPERGVIKNLSSITAVGHRVVHGGEKFTKSVIITDEVLDTFRKLSELAPLHNPPNILGIEAARELLPGIPNMAIMDTAWHQTMPAHVFMYALPYQWYEKYRIRRYGFHGTSLLYVAKRAAVLLGKDPFKCNLVLCHIGNGVSVNAVRNGLSYDTSMGFTPLEGMVMGTRAGDHDPAIDFYIMGKENKTPKEMDAILNKKSGVLGITGRYTDRRDIEQAAGNGDRKARLALEVEAYRIKKYIGGYAAALGGIDAVVFTAGVGEMSSAIRGKALEGLGFLGIKYDRDKNGLARTRNAECEISADGSKVRIFVIPTDEESVMIEDVAALAAGRYDIHTKFTYSFQSGNYVNPRRNAEFKKECRKNPAIRSVAVTPPST